MALGLTQPLTEMSTRNISLPPSYADCLKIWESQPPGTLKACNWIALPFTLPLTSALDEVDDQRQASAALPFTLPLTSALDGVDDQRQASVALPFTLPL